MLGRRLGVLIYRDAARAYGVGMGLVLLPLVYLFREWPPWTIRATLHELPTLSRAALLAGTHAVYGLATLPVVRLLLGSERLRLWWTLPLPTRFWRTLHLRHLVMLDGPWLLAIAYGVLPLSATDGPLSAACSGLAFIGLTLTGQITLASLADRSLPWTAAGVSAWAGAVALAVILPGPVGLGLSALLLLPAVLRLGRPLPETTAVAHGRSGGPPVLALARLGWLAARRRDTVTLAWGIGVQLLAVLLVALAIVHVGADDPSAAASLRAGLAVLCAVVGTALSLRSVRVVHADRPLLDTWGIDPRHERRARLLLAAFGVLPALIAGTVVLPWLGPVGRAWPFDLAIATLWAALGTVRIGLSLERRRRLHEPRLPRHLLWMGVALVLTGIVGTPLVLLPWAAVDAWRLPAVQRQADRARRRFETARRDDHRS